MPITALRMKSLSLLLPPIRFYLQEDRDRRCAKTARLGKQKPAQERRPPDQKPAATCSSGHLATYGAQDTLPPPSRFSE